MLRSIFGGLAVSMAALASVPAQAGLVVMHFSGAVSNYTFLPILQDDFPLGTPVSMTLTYDDSFIARPPGEYFLGMAPSVSGTMQLAGQLYTLTAMRLSYFGYGSLPDDPSPGYGFHVTGTGPATDDGEVFSGIGLHFGGAYLGGPTFIGFGNTNWQVADNGYLSLSGQVTHERLPSPVSAPGTVALLCAGLGGWGLAARTRRPRQSGKQRGAMAADLSRDA